MSCSAIIIGKVMQALCVSMIINTKVAIEAA